MNPGIVCCAAAVMYQALRLGVTALRTFTAKQSHLPRVYAFASHFFHDMFFFLIALDDSDSIQAG
jgi:hypothetical protein